METAPKRMISRRLAGLSRQPNVNRMASGFSLPLCLHLRPPGRKISTNSAFPCHLSLFLCSLSIDPSILISKFYRDRRISSYSDSMILFSNLFDFEIVNCLKVGPRINYINVKKLLRLKYNVFFLSFLQLIYYKDLF